MKIFSVAILALFSFAAADVSHLSRQYLPPKDASAKDYNEQHMHGITTTIEKQQLHELPEQIEFVSSNQPTLRSNNNEQEMEQQQQQMMMTMMMMKQMPDTKYLPPAPAAVQASQQLQLKDLMPAKPSTEYLAPPVREAMPQSQLRMPTMIYLPPPSSVPMQVVEQQPNYQQYQEELSQQQQQQQQEQSQQHTEMLEAMRIAMAAVEQPQMTQAIMEPEPAHVLAADGYHYKNGGGRRLFRFKH